MSAASPFACVICETPVALFVFPSCADLRLCAKCVSHAVLVSAFTEGLGRLAETAQADAVVAQHVSEERQRDVAAMAAARAYRQTWIREATPTQGE
jgi:hypothetical protein